MVAHWSQSIVILIAIFTSLARRGRIQSQERWPEALETIYKRLKESVAERTDIEIEIKVNDTFSLVLGGCN